MNLDKSIEHFITLFDSNFLPMGMALHSSLMDHAQPFHLWILCMDELVEKQLKLISLPNVTLIPLREVETSELVGVRPERSLGEYCWTLTPFTPQAVFERDPKVNRITYLDADVFFFDDPRALLSELDRNRKHILITEHAYDPHYDQSLAKGRFCVQFITFRRTEKAVMVMKWWQDRCLEWCFARLEAGKFGDQKYLDCWSELFGDVVHIVQQTDKTLAPWNVLYIEKKRGRLKDPVFYHFHDLRIISPYKVKLYHGYRIGKQGLVLYKQYLENLSKHLSLLKTQHIAIPYITQTKEKWGVLRYFKRRVTKITRFATIHY
ncbi:MAG: glycosyl transferase [wastewater metagenome]|nr:glycosyl transferase [Candidatus Loosdrechtia aerotolerans]